MTSDVRERHQRGEEPPGEFWCTECLYYPSGSYDTDHVPWPCDAIQQADRADKAEAIARELRLFARHDSSCYFARTGGPCDCGFDEALARFDAEYPE